VAEEKISIIVMADYTRLPAEDLSCIDFVKAMESRIADVPAYMVMEAEDGARDHFALYLAFFAVEDCHIVSAALSFHQADEDADWFLTHWPGFFFASTLEEAADNLFAAVQREMAKRLAQGWWNPTP
jgi:hypothetical protein